ncbi:hypothetical protein QU668_10585 [Schaalia sp. HMT-877]|nr:hypothetical protein HMPREF1550_01557 [Actinomyces sp. oral taxon 877 str. F0543]WLD79962.1 hypothetical protein QU668_10585 [Schaalia sp. HMT-877]
MSPARIRLDRSASSVLAVCSCGWRDISVTESGARALACAHESACHPETQVARQAACHARARRVR